MLTLTPAMTFFSAITTETCGACESVLVRVISAVAVLPASSVTDNFSLPGSDSFAPEEMVFPSISSPALQVLETSSVQVATVFSPILSSLAQSVTSNPPMTLTEAWETEITGALVSLVSMGGVGGVGSTGSSPPQEIAMDMRNKAVASG